ncbi:unnamed protein product, partial [Rotaria magnacalcarata]
MLIDEKVCNKKIVASSSSAMLRNNVACNFPILDLLE